jgi:isocitrate dehydrogenase kinase/phosphatase
MRSPHGIDDLAAWGADSVRRSYQAYRDEFGAITRRARSRFESQDWRGTQLDAAARLEVRARYIQRVAAALRPRLGSSADDRTLWQAMKHAYSRLISRQPDFELAETFFNTVTRRFFPAAAVDPDVQFVASEFEPPPPSSSEHSWDTFPGRGPTEKLVADILRARPFDVPWEDPDRDARLAAGRIDAHLRSLEDGLPVDAAEMLRPIFFRNKGAYLVGRLRRGSLTTPLVLALLHGERGVFVDAALLALADVSNVFSFTRSYFQVEMDRPHDVIAFLRTILPQKRTSELYISLGHNKHGKTELYREILGHLSRSNDRFEVTRGDRGMVMAVFTLPSLDIVFKVIRDRFAFPKSTTRQEVMQKYQLVFRQDRAGRLVDAQEFEHLAFDRSRFAPALLDELARECAESLTVRGGQVTIKHLYAERRVTPLNLYLRDTDEASGVEAVLDYGQAIRDLAATNTFPGDLLLKNFGVTRTGRVIFYDYDELCRVTDCHFRDMPRPREGEEEVAGEPWFFVGADDVFPEEFLPFLGLPGGLKQAFVSTHGELLTAAWWRGIQERHRTGEIVDIFPYRQDQRLGGDGV